MKALILIDIQNGLTKRKDLYNLKIFIDTINYSIRNYRESNSKIIFVQHNNNKLIHGFYDWEVDKRIEKQEQDIVIQKVYGNAFKNTNLKQILLDFKIKSITIGGLVSHGCVKATCLGGLIEGFEISLLKNGHTNWNKDAKNKIEATEKELIGRGVIIETVLINC